MIKRINSYNLVVLSISFIYIAFGVLKILGKSSIQDLVVATLSIMKDPLLFGLFGLFEVILGILLLIPKTRKLGSLLIILHLLSTLATIILASNRIFSSSTIISLEGEFVLKNVILIAVAYFIYKKERWNFKLTL